MPRDAKDDLRQPRTHLQDAFWLTGNAHHIFFRLPRNVSERFPQRR